MSEKQEKQWRDEFEKTISETPLSSKEERLKRLPNQSDVYFWNSIQFQWEGYLAGRKKAQEELKDKDDLIIILKMKLNGLKEKVKELEDQLAKKTDEEITQHKEELKSERFFSSKFELQAMRGFPTGKEWYYLVKEHLKIQKQRKVKL